ncbi:tyrosine-protein phosphatase [Aliiroseovarius subalbicans]|uniref:tyrosine-protein phosphatase n=1 Tax=Aliiroseovarius subalbicans TaxID=2925840 RepID=UPI001F57A995|nr:tyrosine-protein phosphatase [Aliiroseovarius subalbicans]MCI2399050.1 tyrosine-protein phosphatase [Aliiroseovarius subalbicans]
MFNRIFNAFKRWERDFNDSFGDNISTPKGRRQARVHTHVVDHAFLRGIWTNLDQVAPGVWRSNQPSGKRLARHKADGIHTILNLRGKGTHGVYLFEAEACAELGMTLVDHSMDARALASAQEYLTLLDLFDTIEKPFLMHCKSGADRTGLASAFYLIDQMGATPEQAAGQLSLRYIHLKSIQTGILDHLLADFTAEHGKDGISLRDYLATRYDRDALTDSWNAKRGRKG